MGRGGRGGGRYSPNDDRSRSMNSQDVCGQAAMANEARQRGDDDWGDDDGEYYPTDFSEVITQQVEKARELEPTVERLISPTGEIASIRWSRVDQRYILTLSDQVNLVMLLGVPNEEQGIHVDEIPAVAKLLTALGYDVEIEWRPI